MIVVKFGGAAGVDLVAACSDVADLAESGEPLVLVHGGSEAVSRLSARLSVPVREFVSPGGITARHTDVAALEVLILALGQVKSQILVELARRGVPAVGLTGVDGGLLRVKRKRARAVVDGRVVVVRDDFSGQIAAVEVSLLRTLLESGYLPVVSPPALTDEGDVVNVNADRIAARTAGALGADRLILLTAAAGVLVDPQNDESLLGDVELPLEGPMPAYARGGMAVKLIAAREALRAGVDTVMIADGRADRPVHAALAGRGSRVRLDAGESVPPAKFPKSDISPH
jgi:acetylglutamate/LysW-gamma-L-alpha-aminoadipate kinase